jgi:hypothetical protein
MLSLTIVTAKNINFSTINVVSSNIKSLSYNAEYNILIVHFLNGSTYKYDNVSEELFEGFIGVEKTQDKSGNIIYKNISVGKYFNKNIKNNPEIPFEKIIIN